MAPLDRRGDVAGLSTSPKAKSFICTILDGIDDINLLEALKPPPAKHGRTGRPPFPVRAMWRGWLCKYLLNIPYNVVLIEYLESDRRLREVCGFDDTVPAAPTWSRFHSRLSEFQSMVDDILDILTTKLKELLPGLGESVAIDSTSVESFANPNRKHVRDHDAKWGVKHSAKAKEDGTEYFFGYKMHMVADADYGIPLAFRVTPGSTNDSTMLPGVMDKARDRLPWLDPKYLIADRGYDSEKNHRYSVEQGTVPIIHIRETDKNKNSPVYNNVLGCPTCMGGVPMVYIRTDPETGYHLFRCVSSGCHLKPKSNGAWQYCDTDVWEDPMENLRIIGIVARQSPEWTKHYKKRQWVERLFSSLKRSRGLEGHTALNIRRVTLHLTMSTLAYQATALARAVLGQFKKIRLMRVGTP